MTPPTPPTMDANGKIDKYNFNGLYNIFMCDECISNRAVWKVPQFTGTHWTIIGQVAGIVSYMMQPYMYLHYQHHSHQIYHLLYKQQIQQMLLQMIIKLYVYFALLL